MERVSSWLYALGECPELEALRGVPQPEQWHPEGDAYIHTIMVIEQALMRYPKDNRVALGALCHDLGKAYTKKFWPSHYGHADKGVIPTRNVLFRLGYDKDFENQVCFLTKYHMHVHDAKKLKATTLIRIWKDAELVVADPLELLEDLCMLGVCDHYGRGGVKQYEPYIEPYHMLECFKIISWHNSESLLTTELKSIINTINLLRKDKL